jgi:hypothetical protein
VVLWYNTELATAPEATVDTLNNADLVIMGRSTPSSMYQSVENKMAWNELQVPILNVELWNCRSSRLNWFNSTATEHEGTSADTLKAVLDMATDPVFIGITPGEVPWAIGPYDLLREKTAGNGQVVARSAADSSVLFVRFDPFVEFYDGSVDMPFGYRSMIGYGNDATTDPTSGLVIYNYYNFTEESKKVYLAEVERMTWLGTVPIPDWVGVEQNATELPLVYELRQNYPNPFNPVTKIEFTLAKSGQTSLVIYNVMGQVVETLVNENMTMGQHQVDFNAGKHASGMYFYRLKSGDQVMVRKMMLLK